jgi:hypothetical protein
MRKWLGAGVVAFVTAVVIAGRPPPSPLTLLDSFDQALSLVTAAAEQRVAEIERRSEHPAPPRVSFAALVDRAERRLAVAEDAAGLALDRALATVSELTLTRRSAVLACIDHHVAQANGALARVLDGGDDELTRLEAAEYRMTLQRLRAVRTLVAIPEA